MLSSWHSGKSIADICKEHFIPYRINDVGGSTVAYSNNLEQLSHQKMGEINRLFRILKKKMKGYLKEEYQKGNYHLSLEDGLQHAIAENGGLPWAEDSVEQRYFDYRKWIYEEYEGANFDETSYLQLVDMEDLEGGNVMLKHGYRSILEVIQADLPIVLNADVKKITYDGSSASVSVIMRDGDTVEERIYNCKYVICTVSLGVLKDSILLPETSMQSTDIEKGLIQFNPPLPEWKINSLNCHDIGVMDKVLMQFSSSWWGDLHRIVYFSETPGEFPWFDVQPGNIPVLLVWTACRYADKFEKELPEDDHVVQHCMSILRKAFPDAPDPIFSHVTRWRTNPYTRGSYSFIKNGAKPEYLQGISSPVENIYFAGEHCAGPYIGMAHGAYATGKTFAEQIATKLDASN